MSDSAPVHERPRDVGVVVIGRDEGERLVRCLHSVLTIVPASAVVYVDSGDEATERYPFNPNGSVNGIAALCSFDGRHLGMMPHPE